MSRDRVDLNGTNIIGANYQNFKSARESTDGAMWKIK